MRPNFQPPAEILAMAKAKLSSEQYERFVNDCAEAVKNADYETIKREHEDFAFAHENGRKADRAIMEVVADLRLRHAPITIMAGLQHAFLTVMTAYAMGYDLPLEKVREVMESFKSQVLDSIVEAQADLEPHTRKVANPWQ